MRPKKDCLLYNDKYYLKGNLKKKDSGEAFQINKNVYLKEQLVWIKSKYYVKKPYHKFGFRSNLKVKEWFKIGPLSIETEIGWFYDFNDLLKLDRNSYSHTTACGEVILFKDTSNYRNTRPTYRTFDLEQYGADANPLFNSIQEFYNENKDSTCKYSKFLKDYTFGVEYETSLGFLPELICKNTALIPVKDGSLPNGSLEYVTPVMSKEVNTIRRQCEWLSKFCYTDHNTSLHIHIGNLPQEKEFLVAFYMLYTRIQYEIQNISPACKKDVGSIIQKKKQKDHCAFLPSLGLGYGKNYTKNEKLNEEAVNKAFLEIWTFLNEGNKPNENYNPNNRRHIRQGQAKWNFTNRYFNINLIPFLFENKRTIEFRYHYGTTNSTRVINWLLICIACIEFTKTNLVEILEANTKITLLDIVAVLEDQSLVDYLQKYITDTAYEVSTDFINEDKFGLINRDKTKIKEW